MKATENFKQVIQSYLERRASIDDLFRITFNREGKNIDDCILYILSQVKKSGCSGFADEEIYSMAVHYYDEEDIQLDNVSDCHVVVNHVVELTEQEKADAKERAMQEYISEQKRKLKPQQQTQPQQAKAVEFVQPSLF